MTRFQKLLEFDRLPERMRRRAIWHIHQSRHTLADWLVPNGPRRAWRSAVSHVAAWVAPPQVRAIRELNNRHAGQRCFILASGPSINQQQLAGLEHHICISTSSFFLHRDFARLQPRYHCVPNFCSPPHPEAAADRWFAQMHAAIGSATLLTDLRNHRRISGRAFEGRPVYYVSTQGTWDRPIHKPLDLRLPVGPILSVPVLALAYALYMGFAEIFLLGCDHSWLDRFGESQHFYPESSTGWSAWGSEAWSDYGTEVRAVSELWQQYAFLRRYSERRGQRIFNATEGGRLDVFPRVTLSRAMAASPVV